MKKTIRFAIALLFCLALLLGLSACGHTCTWGEWETPIGKKANCTKDGLEVRTCKDDPSHTESRVVPAKGHTSAGPATVESAEYCTVCGSEISPKLSSPMSGKKVIVIGNSHTYFGGLVKEVTQDKMTLSDRSNDKGYFYQLCTANGAEDLHVTNWTFGNHSLKDLFSGDCQANRACGNGTDHLAHLTDNNFDYVIFQNGTSSVDTFMQWIDFMMDFFKAGNPNTKFVMLVPARAHDSHAANPAKYTWLSLLDDIEQKGVTVVDWGAVVYDLYSGAVTLEGTDLEPFNKNSFVIAKSASDGYHPNLLAGYVATVMTYAAITGEDAAGQPYDFCSTTRSFFGFISSYYKVDGTNFVQIFESPDTMRALQELIDLYLEQKKYRNYQ